MTTTDSARVLLPPSLAFERYGADGEVGMLRLSRAAKRNALNDPTVLGIEAFFSAPPAGVKAVVLDAEGEHFCAGLDLSELTERDAFEGLEHSRMWHRAFEQMESGRVPVVAVLKGAVIGGGLELASATHLRVAEPSAVLRAARGAARAVRRRRRLGAGAAADRCAPDGGHDAHRPRARRAGGAGARAVALPRRARERASRKALELAAEDRDELAGHELRRAAGAAADRAGQPARGLPLESLMAALAGSSEQAKSGCRRSCEGRGGEGAAV